MSWQEISQQYLERGLVIVLGAGVSFGSSIPTWEILLGRIAGVLTGDEDHGKRIISDLKGYGFSFPAIASVLEGMCRERDFRDIVRRELYRDFPFRNGINAENREEFVQHTRNNNRTLAAVASLCTVLSQPGSVYEKNPRIHAIVNFNLDSILRAYTYERYGKYLLRSVERASKASDLKKISVYYMHGYLRFDLKETDPAEEAADKMVFTEGDYFEFFNRPTSLFNYTFLYFLREYPCLFVGLSMIDDNIRRLMHYSREERNRAYSEEGRPQRAKEKSGRHFVILERGGADLDVLVDSSVRCLGATVLWVDSYEEIPDRFGSIYYAGGKNWGLVW